MRLPFYYMTKIPVPVLLVMLFLAVLIGVCSPNNKQITLIKTCHVISISTSPKYSFSPELETKYNTDCGISILLTKEHKVGDSIQVNIITNKP